MIYLHYVFDRWVHRWRLTKASGDMIVIRYADGAIHCMLRHLLGIVILDARRDRNAF
jgi:RNA-directed DNA polymerase